MSRRAGRRRRGRGVDARVRGGHDARRRRADRDDAPVLRAARRHGTPPGRPPESRPGRVRASGHPRGAPARAAPDAACAAALTDAAGVTLHAHRDVFAIPGTARADAIAADALGAHPTQIVVSNRDVKRLTVFDVALAASEKRPTLVATPVRTVVLGIAHPALELARFGDDVIAGTPRGYARANLVDGFAEALAPMRRDATFVDDARARRVARRLEIRRPTKEPYDSMFRDGFEADGHERDDEFERDEENREDARSEDARSRASRRSSRWTKARTGAKRAIVPRRGSRWYRARGASRSTSTRIPSRTVPVPLASRARRWRLFVSDGRRTWWLFPRTRANPFARTTSRVDPGRRPARRAAIRRKPSPRPDAEMLSRRRARVTLCL